MDNQPAVRLIDDGLNLGAAEGGRAGKEEMGTRTGGVKKESPIGLGTRGNESEKWVLTGGGVNRPGFAERKRE